MTLNDNTTPSVIFLGVGPGEPSLMTVRGAEILAAADVVISDSPQREELINTLCRDDIEVVDAAYGQKGQALTRASRSKMIVKAAHGGGRVVRLLAGDGITFSGLTEEMLACRKAGVNFEMVPGVSSAAAVPMYAGVPPTTATTAAVHVIDGSTQRKKLVKPDSRDTVVLVGDSEQVSGLIGDVISGGYDGETQAVVTADGSTIAQRSEQMPLQDIPKLLSNPKRPWLGDLVIVAGPAVDLREKTSWFETKPLFGWRVLVPRTQQQSGPMCDAVAVFGGQCDVVPTISVEPPRTPNQMEKAVKGLVTGRYEWVGFTSVNAVKAIREKLTEFGLDARAFAGLKVAAVGGVTADALRAWGIEPDLIPDEEQSARGLLDVWPAYDKALDPIERVLLPRADIATDTLVAGLQELGWEVDDVTAYRTVRAAPPAAEIRAAIKSGEFDAVLFTSSSTVRNLVGIAGKPHACTVVACIGPATAKTAEEHGLKVDVLASEPNSQVLVDALADFGSGLRRHAEATGEPLLRPSQRRPASRRRAAKG